MRSSPAQMAKLTTTANPVRLRCQQPGGEDGITDLSRTHRMTTLLGRA